MSKLLTPKPPIVITPGEPLGIGPDIVIKLIQSFAKTVEHNPHYLKLIVDLLKKSEVTNLAYMVILIKN